MGAESMNFEELIYSWFIRQNPLAAKLTSYNGKPGIFYQNAPTDASKGWKGGRQFPRAVFDLDMQADKERKSSGTLLVTVFCDEKSDEPEMIEPLIKDCLKGLIITPVNGTPHCFAWSRSDGFEIPQNNTRIIGMEIRFDVMEYPSQETTDPDPVVALNRYIKAHMESASVIGIDDIGIFRTASAPVFYCRLEAVEKGIETNTVAWMDGKIAVHLLLNDPAARLKWIMALANWLSLDGEVIMLDGSPMKIKRLVVNNGADYLREGQLFVTVGYGLLRYKAQPHILTDANLDYRL